MLGSIEAVAALAAAPDAAPGAVTGFVLVYVAALILVWTGSNNDPIYTRFLFPVYPFLILSGLAMWSTHRDRAPRLLLSLLGLLFVAVNVANVVLGLI